MRFHFAPFILDTETRQLLHATRAVHLSPKAFELLLVLVEARPKVLSKTVLQQHLWPDTFVAEANLSNLLAEVRDALGDKARAPRYIRTSHGFGYAFIADTTTASPAAPSAGRSMCWLEWNRKRFPLAIGAHVIGRDPDVEIRLDGTTVSRRHARIVVTATGTSVEDFGSKNGTYKGNERITSPVPLTHGDAIRIGSLLLTFHARAGSTTTETQERPGL
jgi:DNA-binding winged helix-turn-helix (wHTH) protein